LTGDKKFSSKAGLIYKLLLTIACLMLVIFLLTAGLFIVSGQLYLYIVLLSINLALLLFSICMVYTKNQTEKDLIVFNYEKKKPVDSAEQDKKFQDDLLYFLKPHEKIDITTVTDYFFPRGVNEMAEIPNHLHWKTKMKSWKNYERISKSIEKLLQEKKIPGFLRVLGTNLFYINPKDTKISSDMTNNFDDFSLMDLDLDVVKNICPNCGYKIEKDWNTCPKCSKKL